VSAVTVLVTALAIPKAVKAWDEVLSIKNILCPENI
jgi:hypothetical protein